MQWTDEGIVIGVRAHGETGAVAEFLTREHGRHLGFVHGGQSRKLRPVLQIGNQVGVEWRARTADQLGHFKVELSDARAAALMDDPAAVSGLLALAEMARLLPEREPHANLYEVTQFVLSFLDDLAIWPAMYVRWELALLEELGIGLDLAACAATGTRDDLVYVSPRSGRAVSRDAGRAYADRLFVLPGFLRRGDNRAVELPDAVAGLEMTAHFFERRLLGPEGRGLPEPRKRLSQFLSERSAPSPRSADTD
ncbi:MAG: DNA repair protein RecO [Hyphomicrobiaceae bacterium]